MRTIVDDENPYWTNVTFDYPEAADAGRPSRTSAPFGSSVEAFDGELADRLSENIIAGLGEWPTPENMTDKQGIILPSTIASEAQASVGDTLNRSPLCMWWTSPRFLRER